MTGGGILVAGMGNELLGDDGFGIAAARRCAAAGLGADVRVVEAGIAGIGLVQDLMDRYDTVIILDAVNRGSRPGAVHVFEVSVPDVRTLTAVERRELLADMHATVPSRVLVLAQALGVLPRAAYLVGCEPRSLDLGDPLSPPVAAALDVALDRVRGLVAASRAVGERHPHLAASEVRA